MDLDQAKTYGLDLKSLPKSFPLEVNGTHFTPQRNHFYFYSGQNLADGRFGIFGYYLQEYSNDGSNGFTSTFLDTLPKFIRVKRVNY